MEYMESPLPNGGVRIVTLLDQSNGIRRREARVWPRSRQYHAEERTQFGATYHVAGGMGVPAATGEAAYQAAKSWCME